MSTMTKNPPKAKRDDDRPRHKWAATISELGESGLALRAPLTVTLEDYGDEVVASYPEVEAFGSGSTEADAINDLKDEIANLYVELTETPQTKLGKLPRRWKRALCAVAHPTVTP
jgi:hypothetical protein